MADEQMIANAGTVTDADGNVYQTVKIGNQVWMTENLRVTKYSDGSAILLVTDSDLWRRICSLTTPAYCYYKNMTNTDSIKKYGALYNWHVVNPANPKKIAPTGWHVPFDVEWDTLQNYLIAKGYNWDGTITGNKIAKSLAAKTDWWTNSTRGTIGCDLTMNNSSGFSALPGGYRGDDGAFSVQSVDGLWWSATEYGASAACYRCLGCGHDSLNNGYGHLIRFNLTKSCGFSIRLVKD